MTDVARVRIGRVKLKNGPVIIRLPTHNERRTKAIYAWMRDVLDMHVSSDCSLDGFAFVVWDRDGSSTCKMIVGDGIPAMLAPDFIRNRLMAEKIQSWTLDEVNRQWNG